MTSVAARTAASTPVSKLTTATLVGSNGANFKVADGGDCVSLMGTFALDPILTLENDAQSPLCADEPGQMSSSAAIIKIEAADFRRTSW